MRKSPVRLLIKNILDGLNRSRDYTAVAIS